MNKNKIISACLAAVMLSSGIFTSCSKKETEPPKQKRTNVFAGEEISVQKGISYISKMDYKDGKIYLSYGKQYTITRNELGEEVERREGYFWDDNEETPVAVPMAVEEVEEEIEETTEATAEEATESGSNKLPDGWYYDYQYLQMVSVLNTDDNSIQEYDLPSNLVEGANYSSMTISSDGNVNLLYCKYNWDPETYESTSEYTIVKYDIENSKELNTVNINEGLVSAGLDVNNLYLNNFYVSDSDEYYLTYDTTIVVLNSDFSYKSKYVMDSGWISNMMLDGDKVYVMYYPDNGAQSFKVIDNGTMTDLKAENLTLVMNGLYNILGIADNKMYYTNSTGVSIYDFTTDTYSEILNYINSDISPNNVGNMYLLPDGRIIMATTEWTDDDNITTIQMLTKIPDEELQEEIIVKIGSVYSNYYLTNSIIRYNKQNNGIRISLVTYEKYNNEDNNYTGASTQFSNDIITGNMPDIILLDTSLPVESYFQQGIFADLNEFVDDEENGINRADYLTNVFDACTVDGKLYSMIMSYSIRTLMAKAKYVGSESGWTFEDMMNCINNMPEGMTAFYDSSRDNIIDNFFNNSMDSFVDWNTGETKFETQGFIDFIKFLASCPEKGYWESYYDSMGDNYVYDEEAEREMQQNYELRFYKDKGLFDFAYISNFNSLLYERNAFATTDVTAVGYPTDSGNGAIIYPNLELAISNNSPVKAQAWDILKFFLNDDEITNRDYTFSVNVNNLNKMAEKAMENFYYYETSDDDLVWYKDMGYSEEYLDYLKKSNQKLDQSVIDITMSLVKNATQVSRSDTELVNIVKEELSSFFGGTKSAEETAKVIAGRVKIYVSEHS